MMVSFHGTYAHDQSVFVAVLRPEEVMHLPGVPLKVTGRHVVRVEGGVASQTELRAPFSGLSVLALGTSDEAVIVMERERTAGPQVNMASASVPLTAAQELSPGDRAFIAALAETGPDLQRAGKALLTRIRKLHPGGLSVTKMTEENLLKLLTIIGQSRFRIDSENLNLSFAALSLALRTRISIIQASDRLLIFTLR